MSNIKVSIIIPTFERYNSVKRALSSLSNQTFPPNLYEVIVSIDGSKDSTEDLVKTFPAEYGLRSVWNPHAGRAAARNAGIQGSKGEILIFIDDDMEPGPKFVEAHYSSHRGNKKRVVVGSVPITMDQSSPPIVQYVGMKFNLHTGKISAPGYNLRIWDFYSGNFSINRNDMIEVGQFDESFEIYGYEDVELANRLLKAGLTIIFSPEAMCIQHYEEDFRGLAYKTISSGMNAVKLASLHPETFNETKLIEYNLTGWKWRSLRLFLIWTSTLIPATTNVLIFIINLFERPDSRVHERLYHLAMDYFFWFGVWTALRNHKCKKELVSKIKSSKNPQRCLKP